MPRITSTRRSPRAGVRVARLATPGAALLAAAALAMVPSAAHAAPGTPVPLGAASTFVVLAGETITNTGATTLGGDIGVAPGSAVTGEETITLVGGVNRTGEAVTTQAKTDLVTAYNAASAQSPDPLGGVELGGLTLEPGVYDTGGVIELNGNLTLDGNGDPNAVFVFQSLSSLLAGAASSITFIDGATACNLYWRVPESAEILAGSQFAGTILAEVSIAFAAGATLQGRALAQTGEVTMINNTITLPECSAATPTTPPVTDGSDGSDDGTAGTVQEAAEAPQVAVAPSGGVATGDGSSLPTATGSSPLLAVAVLTGLGLVGWTVTRTRRAHPGE